MASPVPLVAPGAQKIRISKSMASSLPTPTNTLSVVIDPPEDPLR